MRLISSFRTNILFKYKQHRLRVLVHKQLFFESNNLPRLKSAKEYETRFNIHKHERIRDTLQYPRARKNTKRLNIQEHERIRYSAISTSTKEWDTRQYPRARRNAWYAAICTRVKSYMIRGNFHDSERLQVRCNFHEIKKSSRHAVISMRAKHNEKHGIIFERK